MASIQYVLTNGTTADANEVMSNFNEIYSDIDQTNIGAANKTGTGKIVLDTSPTISGLNVSSPVLSGTVTGTYTLAGTPTLSGTFAGTPAYSGLPTFSAGITIPTTQRINLNVGGTTHIYESSSNNLKTVVNSVTCFDAGITDFTLGGAIDFKLQSTRRFYLDGGGDTYLAENISNRIDFYCGGSQAAQFRSTICAFVADVQLTSGRKLYFDNGGDTYDVESSADVLDRYAGGVLALRCTSTTAVIHTNSTFNTSGELTLGDLSAPSSIAAASRRSFISASGRVVMSTNTLSGAWNVTSTTHPATGSLFVNFTTAFSNANYKVTATCSNGSNVFISTLSRSTTQVEFSVANSVPAFVDVTFDFIITGT